MREVSEEEMCLVLEANPEVMTRLRDGDISALLELLEVCTGANVEFFTLKCCAPNCEFEGQEVWVLTDTLTLRSVRRWLCPFHQHQYLAYDDDGKIIYAPPAE